MYQRPWYVLSCLWNGFLSRYLTGPIGIYANNIRLFIKTKGAEVKKKGQIYRQIDDDKRNLAEITKTDEHKPTLLLCENSEIYIYNHKHTTNILINTPQPPPQKRKKKKEKKKKKKEKKKKKKKSKK